MTPPLCCACCAATRVNLRRSCREQQLQQAVTYDSYTRQRRDGLQPRGFAGGGA